MHSYSTFLFSLLHKKTKDFRYADWLNTKGISLNKMAKPKIEGLKLAISTN